MIILSLNFTKLIIDLISNPFENIFFFIRKFRKIKKSLRKLLNSILYLILYYFINILNGSESTFWIIYLLSEVICNSHFRSCVLYKIFSLQIYRSRGHRIWEACLSFYLSYKIIKLYSIIYSWKKIF
jgi:hypothetical protein